MSDYQTKIFATNARQSAGLFFGFFIFNSATTKKFLSTILSLSLYLGIILGSIVPVSIFSVQVAHADALSVGIFPSTLVDMPLVQTGTQVTSPCYVQAKEFVTAAYISGAEGSWQNIIQLNIGISSYADSDKAENVARNCIVTIKEEFGNQASWGDIVDTTVSGYKSISISGEGKAEAGYFKILYTIKNEFLIVSMIVSQQTISDQTLKDANSTLAAKLPSTAPKKDGENCQNNYECRSGYCLTGKCTITSFEKPEEKSMEPETTETEFIPQTAYGNDGICDYGEKCATKDCENSLKCWIDWECDWGGENVRSAVGCIASIAVEMNIVAKVADIIEGIGCGICGNFMVGILDMDIDRTYAGLVSFIYTAIDAAELSLGQTAQLVLKIISCIDGYFGISRYFLVEIVYQTIGILRSVGEGSATAISMESPASLLVRDNTGNLIGVDTEGNLHENIEGGFYIEFPKADIKAVVLTGETASQNFTVQTQAEEAGKINLKIARSNGKKMEQIAYNNIVQDENTATSLSFSGRVGAKTEAMNITSAQGGIVIKSADQIRTDEVEIPTKYKAGRFWRKFGMIVIFLSLVILAVAIYICRKKLGELTGIFKKKIARETEKESSKISIFAPKKKKRHVIIIALILIVFLIAIFYLG